VNTTSTANPVIPIPQPPPAIGSESPGAYDAFLCYFELGRDRTLKKTAEILDISEHTVNDWSSRYAWRQRGTESSAASQPARDPALQSMVNELGACLLRTSSNLLQHHLLNNPENIDMGQVLRMMQLGEKLLNSSGAHNSSTPQPENAPNQSQPRTPPPAV
jgi:hypothetical protein